MKNINSLSKKDLIEIISKFNKQKLIEIIEKHEEYKQQKGGGDNSRVEYIKYNERKNKNYNKLNTQTLSNNSIYNSIHYNKNIKI
jgi:hypothetical protein